MVIKNLKTKEGRRTAALAVFVLAALTVAYAVQLRKDMTDFGVCYQAGERIRAGETLYRASDGHLQYKYAPAASILYAPFSLLPRRTANAAWFAFELFLMAACFALAYGVLSPPRRAPVLVLGLSFLVLGKFIGREFELGQVNFLILGLILTSLAFLQKKRDGYAGAAWALSLFFKPYALVFLPYFLLRKRFRIVASGALVLAAGLAAPAFFYGWSGNLGILAEWFRTLSQSTPILLQVGDNASLYAILAKHLGGGTASNALFLGSAVALGVILLVVMFRAGRQAIPHSETLEFAFLLVLVPMLSPLGWYYNYLYGLGAAAVILNGFSRLSPVWKYLAAADLFMIGGTLREILGKTAFRFYTHHSLVAVNFLVLLAILARLRATKDA
jgi:hypothetical protein